MSAMSIRHMRGGVDSEEEGTNDNKPIYSQGSENSSEFGYVEESLEGEQRMEVDYEERNHAKKINKNRRNQRNNNSNPRHAYNSNGGVLAGSNHAIEGATKNRKSGTRRKNINYSRKTRHCDFDDLGPLDQAVVKQNNDIHRSHPLNRCSVTGEEPRIPKLKKGWRKQQSSTISSRKKQRMATTKAAALGGIQGTNMKFANDIVNSTEEEYYKNNDQGMDYCHHSTQINDVNQKEDHHYNHQEDQRPRHRAYDTNTSSSTPPSNTCDNPICLDEEEETKQKEEPQTSITQRRHPQDEKESKYPSTNDTTTVNNKTAAHHPTMEATSNEESYIIHDKATTSSGRAGLLLSQDLIYGDDGVSDLCSTACNPSLGSNETASPYKNYGTPTGTPTIPPPYPSSSGATPTKPKESKSKESILDHFSPTAEDKKQASTQQKVQNLDHAFEQVNVHTSRDGSSTTSSMSKRRAKKDQTTSSSHAVENDVYNVDSDDDNGKREGETKSKYFQPVSMSTRIPKKRKEDGYKSLLNLKKCQTSRKVVSLGKNGRKKNDRGIPIVAGNSLMSFVSTTAATIHDKFSSVLTPNKTSKRRQPEEVDDDSVDMDFELDKVLHQSRLEQAEIAQPTYAPLSSTRTTTSPNRNNKRNGQDVDSPYEEAPKKKTSSKYGKSTSEALHYDATPETRPNTRRMTRSSSNKAKKNEASVITIIDDDDDDDGNINVDQDPFEETDEEHEFGEDNTRKGCHTRQSSAKKEKKTYGSRGNIVEAGAVRIAVGENIYTSECSLVIKLHTRKPHIIIQYKCPKEGTRRRLRSRKLESRYHRIDIPTKSKMEEISEIKYFHANDDGNLNEVPDKKSTVVLDESDSDEQMSFLALKICPNEANKIPDELPYLNNCYVVIEMRANEDLVKIIQTLFGFECFEKFVDNSELQHDRIGKYVAALNEDSKKDRDRRVSATSKRSSKSGSDEIVLVYPFNPLNPGELERVADDFPEACGKIPHFDANNEVLWKSAEETVPDPNKNDAPDPDNQSSAITCGSTKRNQVGIVSIIKEDFDRLRDDEYLNDTLIDFWMTWIFRNEDPQNSSLHFFSSHFYTKLSEEGVDSVTRWTSRRNVNIFEKKFVFIPINGNLHWSLCVVVNPGKIYHNHIHHTNEEGHYTDQEACFILFLDSLKAHKKSKVANFVRKWLDSEARRLNHFEAKIDDDQISRGIFTKTHMPVFDTKIPYQDNSWDCGVFVCRYAYSMMLLRDEIFTFGDWDDKFVQKISQSPVFSFDMEDIYRIRESMARLIEKLAIPYKEVQQIEAAELAKMKREKKAAKATKRAQEEELKQASVPLKQFTEPLADDEMKLKDEKILSNPQESVAKIESVSLPNNLQDAGEGESTLNLKENEKDVEMEDVNCDNFFRGSKNPPSSDEIVDVDATSGASARHITESEGSITTPTRRSSRRVDRPESESYQEPSISSKLMQEDDYFQKKQEPESNHNDVDLESTSETTANIDNKPTSSNDVVNVEMDIDSGKDEHPRSARGVSPSEWMNADNATWI